MWSRRILVVLCLIYVFLQIDCRPPTATSSGDGTDDNSTAPQNTTGKHKAIMGRFISAPCKAGYTKVGNSCKLVQGG